MDKKKMRVKGSTPQSKILLSTVYLLAISIYICASTGASPEIAHPHVTVIMDGSVRRWKICRADLSIC